MIESKDIPIRLAVQSDMPYVLNSWSRAAYSHLQSALFLSSQGPPPPYGLWKRLFDDWQHRLLETSQILVACDFDDPGTILGYCIWSRQATSPPLLHYLQTKRDLMRKGVASTLLARAGISRDDACVYTFTSPIQGKVKTPEHWSYVPYWLVTNG